MCRSSSARRAVIPLKKERSPPGAPQSKRGGELLPILCHKKEAKSTHSPPRLRGHGETARRCPRRNMRACNASAPRNADNISTCPGVNPARIFAGKPAGVLAAIRRVKQNSTAATASVVYYPLFAPRATHRVALDAITSGAVAGNVFHFFLLLGGYCWVDYFTEKAQKHESVCHLNESVHHLTNPAIRPIEMPHHNENCTDTLRCTLSVFSALVENLLIDRA